MCSSLVKNKWAWLKWGFQQVFINQKLHVNCFNISKIRRNGDSLISLLAAFKPCLCWCYKFCFGRLKKCLTPNPDIIFSRSLQKRGLVASRYVLSVFLKRRWIYCMTWGMHCAVRCFTFLKCGVSRAIKGISNYSALEKWRLKVPQV